MRLLPVLLTLLTFITVAPRLSAAVIGGPITNSANGHIYYLLSTNRWTVSEAEAQALGGHLVTLNDQEEHNWVLATFGNYRGVPRSLWIGLTDREEEGVFKWVTGEPLTFSIWCEGEPNDTDFSEDYVHIFDPADHLDRGGTWNDSDDLLFFDGEYPVYGVVEATGPIPPTVLSIQKAVAIEWFARPGIVYQIQWSPDISNDSLWVDLGEPITGDGSTRRIFDVAEPGSVRFYRFVEVE